MMLQKIRKTLLNLYFKQTAIAAFLIILTWIMVFFQHSTSHYNNRTLSVILVSLSGIFGLALPVFYRSYFISGLKDAKKISTETFINFEKNIIKIALIAPYFLILSIALHLSERTHILIFLFSLYALYYYYPSNKKIIFEMKIFRIK